MINDECEMLNENDKANPKKAQQALDRIMADSRPALEWFEKVRDFSILIG